VPKSRLGWLNLPHSPTLSPPVTVKHWVARWIDDLLWRERLWENLLGLYNLKWVSSVHETVVTLKPRLFTQFVLALAILPSSSSDCWLDVLYYRGLCCLLIVNLFMLVGNINSLVRRRGPRLCAEFSRQSRLWWDLGENLSGTIANCYSLLV